MGDFPAAFEAMIQAEGGYKLTDIPGDRGGQTYAGISRKMNPAWPGWAYIDRGEIPPTQMVRDFYLVGYWVPIRGDELPAAIARTLFDFAVNSSAPGHPAVAVKLAQIVVGVTADGSMGPKTVAALNACDPHVFGLAYTLAKVARYAEICNRDRGQGKFLLGWINRALKGAS